MNRQDGSQAEFMTYACANRVSPLFLHKRRSFMDQLLIGVVVGSLGTTLIGTLYFLWVRSTKKENA